MKLKALKGNRLTDGEAVWLTRADDWSPNVAAARVEKDEAGHNALEAVGVRDTDRGVVVDAELIDVHYGDGAPVPSKLKERIRALGPTVRLDLGKQAQTTSKLERVA